MFAVSRQQFDDLMSILSPGGQATPALKARLARTYAELLAFDSAARALGIDSSPQYRNTMQWVEAKTLADLLRHRLEKESSAVSEPEIEAYYRERFTRFEEVRLRRLVLPKSNSVAGDRQTFEEYGLRVAAGLRERAARGEDLERLQKEGYEALGLGVPLPTTEVGTRRRADLLPGVSEELFALRPGKVSKVENEPYSFVIYKVEAKSRCPLEQVREEIIREIAKQKLERALEAITLKVRTELSEKYFGTPSAQ
jgi:hypothetical protein